MKHFYETIPGWFDFDDLYHEAVRTARDGAKMLEIGTWVGRSLSYLGVEIVNSVKRIELHSCDPCGVIQPIPHLIARDSLATDAYRESIERHEGRVLADVLRENMAPLVAEGIDWTHHWMTARELGEQNWKSDRCFDFVFVDGDHSYDGVMNDLKAWWPMVKVGGRLGGHDFTPEFQGVLDAVNEFFSGGDGRQASNIRVSRNSFYVDKVRP